MNAWSQAALAWQLSAHPMHDLVHYCKIVLFNTLEQRCGMKMGALDFRLLCSRFSNEGQSSILSSEIVA